MNIINLTHFMWLYDKGKFFEFKYIIPGALKVWAKNIWKEINVLWPNLVLCQTLHFMSGSFRILGFVFCLEYLSPFFLKVKKQGQFRNPHDEQIFKLSLILCLVENWHRYSSLKTKTKSWNDPLTFSCPRKTCNRSKIRKKDKKDKNAFSADLCFTMCSNLRINFIYHIISTWLGGIYMKRPVH